MRLAFDGCAPGAAAGCRSEPAGRRRSGIAGSLDLVAVEHASSVSMLSRSGQHGPDFAGRMHAKKLMAHAGGAKHQARV